MTHDDVRAWLAGYERAWRSAGTDGLAELFTADATYSPSPWREPVRGLAALAPWWEGERDGPDEQFTATYRVLAVDGSVAVVRAEVDYASTEGNHGRWRDLWVLEFADDGRVRAFEEWPFAPPSPTATGTERAGSVPGRQHPPESPLPLESSPCGCSCPVGSVPGCC